MELTAAAAWINSAFSGFDSTVTTAIHKLYDLGGGFFTPFFEFISFFGKAGLMLILFSAVLVLFKSTRRFGTAMLIGLAIGAIITNVGLKPSIARPRPYADENSLFYQFWLLVGQNLESDKSFPSGHTTAAFAAMTPLFIEGKKKIKFWALLFAVLMGIARIYLCVHFPSDVLAGIIIGILGGVLGVVISRKLPEKWYELTIIKTKYQPQH